MPRKRYTPEHIISGYRFILVGSETGAPLNYISPFPAPASSNAACRFPALRFLVNFA